MPSPLPTAEPAGCLSRPTEGLEKPLQGIESLRSAADSSPPGTVSGQRPVRCEVRWAPTHNHAGWLWNLRQPIWQGHQQPQPAGDAWAPAPAPSRSLDPRLVWVSAVLARRKVTPPLSSLLASRAQTRAGEGKGVHSLCHQVDTALLPQGPPLLCSQQGATRNRASGCLCPLGETSALGHRARFLERTCGKSTQP